MTKIEENMYISIFVNAPGQRKHVSKRTLLTRHALMLSFVCRANIRGKPTSLEHTVIYPPNGVVPFHGFAMFCAPFCYVYDDPVQLYLGTTAFQSCYLYFE